MLLKFIFQKNQPQRLGNFLSEHGITKQAITDAKHHDGLILVNKKRRHTTWLLHFGDVVYFLTGKEPVNEYLQPNFSPLVIVHETSSYLLVNKPAGLLSMPSKYNPTDSVVNRVLGYLKSTGQKDARPHLVSRLDQYTSGLLLVAKNSLTHALFAAMGKDVLVKRYQAIVHGQFLAQATAGRVVAPISQVGGTVRRTVADDGQYAATKYEVLAQTDFAARVSLQLETGRTHQIRVHMQHLGHPLYGDQLYGIEDEFDRQALHCCSLTFPDPFTHTQKTVEINLPADMIELWNRLEVHDDI